mmetsp:Transcript_10663/g.26758  ORF Transcript_10663/g.26758 Transcript_10663/m.26758 type:complete len:213 (-) Transcript_10663:149-787(-)
MLLQADAAVEPVVTNPARQVPQQPAGLVVCPFMAFEIGGCFERCCTLRAAVGLIIGRHEIHAAGGPGGDLGNGEEFRAARIDLVHHRQVLLEGDAMAEAVAADLTRNLQFLPVGSSLVVAKVFGRFKSELALQAAVAIVLGLLIHVLPVLGLLIHAHLELLLCLLLLLLQRFPVRRLHVSLERDLIPIRHCALRAFMGLDPSVYRADVFLEV